MIKSTIPKMPNKELFCQKYWRTVLERKKTIERGLTTQHMDFLNRRILGLRNGYNSNKAYQKALFNADFAIKTSKPLKWKRVLYRGVSKGENSDLTEYFNKCKNLKKGDYICFPQYAFITKYKELAKLHMHKKSNESLFFQITIPRNAKILTLNYNYCLPRNSILLCTGVKNKKYDDGIYKYIKLKLIPMMLSSQNCLKI